MNTHKMAIATTQASTRNKYVGPALWAFLPATIWACAMMLINHFYGAHSMLGFWAALVGIPGVAVGGFLNYVTGSETAFYVGLFLGNWLFCFIVFKVAVVLKNRFA